MHCNAIVRVAERADVKAFAGWLWGGMLKGGGGRICLGSAVLKPGISSTGVGTCSPHSIRNELIRKILQSFFF